MLAARFPVSCVDCIFNYFAAWTPLTDTKILSVAFRVWVAQRITSILGFEDEVVVELVFGHLEVRALLFLTPRAIALCCVCFCHFSLKLSLLQTPAQQGGHESTINPKDMQIQLTGFLGAEQGMLFMKDLWVLLLSAQVRSHVLCPADCIEILGLTVDCR